jgi:hypothetical protein
LPLSDLPIVDQGNKLVMLEDLAPPEEAEGMLVWFEMKPKSQQKQARLLETVEAKRLERMRLARSEHLAQCAARHAC